MVDIALREMGPRPIAVARRQVSKHEIAVEVRPALDTVWQFVHSRGLEAGHNVAVYASGPDGVLTAWFGVEVSAPFEGDCSIDCASMPVGLTAVATHVGTYDALSNTYRELRQWCVAQGHAMSGTSWEIYGDWTEDPAELATTIGILLD